MLDAAEFQRLYLKVFEFKGANCAQSVEPLDIAHRDFGDFSWVTRPCARGFYPSHFASHSDRPGRPGRLAQADWQLYDRLVHGDGSQFSENLTTLEYSYGSLEFFQF